MEKIIPRHITMKVFKTSDKEKILKAFRGKRHIPYRGRKKRGQQIFHQKPCKPDDSGAKSLKF